MFKAFFEDKGAVRSFWIWCIAVAVVGLLFFSQSKASEVFAGMLCIAGIVGVLQTR